MAFANFLETLAKLFELQIAEVLTQPRDKLDLHFSRPLAFEDVPGFFDGWSDED